MRALAALKRDGIATEIGLSNVNRRALEEALAVTEISALEVRLGAYDDGALRSGLVAFARERGITVLAHTPLGGPRGAARLAREPVLLELAARHATTPSTLVLGWLCSLDVVPLPGATRVETARLAARAATLRSELTQTELEAIGRAVGSGPRPAPTAARAPTAASTAASTSAAAPQATTARSSAEIVLVMGIQGAGKTSAVASFVERGYARLNRDLSGGTLKKLHRSLDEHLAAGVETSFVLDNTYPTRTVRADVVDIARRHGVPVRCVWLETPLEDAQINVIDRMLAHHGTLLSGEAIARAAKVDPGVFLPTVQHRFLRELEPPADDEGFAAIERVPFVRVPLAGHDRAGRVVAIDALANADQRGLLLEEAARTPTLIVGWSPPEAPAEPDLLSVLSSAPVTVALCQHGGGPPACWCRPPLPGLVVPWLRAERIDPARTTFLGTSRAHRTLADALRIPFRLAPHGGAAP